ncbi:MAG: cell envelope integrity protein CreD [Saprospirales bacterium]|nr:cell envelope integrity protein CreD [Saprospirales bacterium]
MQNQDSSTMQRFSHWLKKSLFVKLGSIGFLVLLLLLPNAMIRELITERQYRQEEAVASVSHSWGAAQRITGPVLSIPFTSWVEQENGKRTAYQEIAHFLPERLDIDGDMEHQIRQKGIFDVILYQSTLQIRGAFLRPDFSALHVQPEDVHWEQAKISLGITGMSGIKNSILLDWGGEELRMEPGTAYPALLPSGVSIGVPVAEATESYAFSIPLKINGSHSMEFEPVGKETKVSLKSGWHSPSFEGAFLPEPREVGPDGFSASWNILDLNRNYPQSWKNETFKLGESAFGVRLIKPIDEYMKNERSAKYAILVIGLTFLIYFFFEILRKFHIHPLQYFLIGIALIVFYLLLLSLSEQIGFDPAYLIASVATVGLISGYTASFLKSGPLALQLALLLALIYGFIFIVLQLEDYALLAGSVGIFAALAAVMYYSRKVDWYNLGD